MTAMAMLHFDAADPEALELANEAYGLAGRARDDTLIKGAAITVGHMLAWSGDATPVHGPG